MMAAAASAAPVDERLAVRAPAVADQQTFISLCETHIEGVYDFALRMLRDREAAERVVQIAFEKAREVLLGRGSSRNPIASLYALARSCALDDLRRRRGPGRVGPRDREGFVFTRVETDRLSDPSAVFDKELIELVWDVAAVLSPEEYSLLDLHLRRELTVAELAEHLDLNGSADTHLSHLRGVLEDEVRSRLIATRRRAICVRLDAALAETERRLASDVRRIVRRHLDDCEHCRECEHRFVSPAEVFHSLMAIAPSPALRKQLLQDLERKPKSAARLSRLRRLAFG